jgi:hypothetical protein
MESLFGNHYRFIGIESQFIIFNFFRFYLNIKFDVFLGWKLSEKINETDLENMK